MWWVLSGGFGMNGLVGVLGWGGVLGEGKYRVFIDPIIKGNISYIAFCKVFSDYQKMLDDYQKLSKWLIDALDKREKAYTNRNVSILKAAYRQIDAEQAIAAFKCPETDFALV
jgi:hypothetical protein